MEVMHQLNARRLLCPLPVIRTQNAIKKLAVGEQIEVFATDPGVLQDIPAWARIHGHKVILAEKGDDEIRIVLEVGAS